MQEFCNKNSLFLLQFYRSEAWFELNKEQINAARTVQVFILISVP